MTWLKGPPPIFAILPLPYYLAVKVGFQWQVPLASTKKLSGESKRPLIYYICMTKFFTWLDNRRKLTVLCISSWKSNGTSLDIALEQTPIAFKFLTGSVVATPNWNYSDFQKNSRSANAITNDDSIHAPRRWHMPWAWNLKGPKYRVNGELKEFHSKKSIFQTLVSLNPEHTQWFIGIQHTGINTPTRWNPTDMTPASRFFALGAAYRVARLIAPGR